MKNLLLLCLLALLASCATTKPLSTRLADAQNAKSYGPAAPAPAESAGAPRAEPGSPADFIRRIFQGHPPVVQLELEAAPDSLPFVHVAKSPQKPTPKRRLLGLLPPKKADTAAAGHMLTAQNATQMPRKCKGCQILIQNGDGNTSTQASTAKKGQTLGDGASNVEKAKAPVATNAATAQDYTKQAQRGGAAASGAHAQASATKESGWLWWLWLLLVGVVGTIIYRIYKRFSPI